MNPSTVTTGQDETMATVNIVRFRDMRDKQTLITIHPTLPYTNKSLTAVCAIFRLPAQIVEIETRNREPEMVLYHRLLTSISFLWYRAATINR